MFFDDVEQIWDLAGRTGASLFVLPKDVAVERKGAIILKPEDKSIITIEQVQKMIERLSVRQSREQFIVIRPAEKMGVESANAFLKNLEEPNEKIHFVLITSAPSMILPTILSRVEMYFLRTRVDFREVKADEKVKAMAKRLMVAKPAELPQLAEEIAKKKKEGGKKDGVREFALEVVGTAIEMLYKSYFLTEKEVFLNKLPKFLSLYEALSKNGHIKLQIVSNLC